LIILRFLPSGRVAAEHCVCLNFAQLYRPHDKQYIALHKKGKPYFASQQFEPVFAPVWASSL
jgi:hypothetical protein